MHGVPDIYVPPVNDQSGRVDVIPEDPFKIPPEFHHYDGYAQDLSLLYGKILRIDVTMGRPGYAIPPTNPFRGGEHGRPEIYAWGFRNPFRIAFDRVGNGDLVVTGVAESFWETIYRVDGPGNYGWAIREGTHCYDRARAFDPPETCPKRGPLGEPIRDPIVEYAELVGKAARGQGRGRAAWAPPRSAASSIGDRRCPSSTAGSCSAISARCSNGRPGRSSWPPRRHPGVRSGPSSPCIQLDQRLHTLGEDAAGELYLLTTAQGIPVGQTGKVWKLVPAKAR